MESTRHTGTRRGSALAGIACLLLAAAALTAPGAAAQAPAPAIDLIVPTAAQGSTDLLARLVAEGLSRRGFGEVRVRNMPGRSGTLAAAHVAAAAPDGRTLLVATPSSHGIASAFEPNLPYDPVAGFTPILRFAAAPYLLVVRPGGVATLPQFREQARAANGQWRYASTGAGGPHHLVAEFYFRRAGLKLEHVPASGGAAALGLLKDGRVEVMLPAAILALPQVKGGQLKALAVTGDRRLPSLPDVPTFAEAGIPVDVVSWYGLMAPAGLPAAQARRLADAVQAIMAEPALEARLAEMATTRTADVGPEFARIVAAEVDRWKALVGELGIRAESSPAPRSPLAIVVPFPPGGIDVIGRMMQPGLARALGQEVTIVNRPGGAGAAGSSEVARAAPDGRTLLLAPQGPLAYQPQIAAVDYDGLRSFVPVCRVTSTPSVLMAAGTTTFNRVADIVAAARAEPGRIRYSSAGAGSLPHVGMAAFAKRAGLDLNHAPAAGAAASVAALKEGKAELLAEQLPIAMASKGQTRIVGVFSAERVAALPDVPTMREQGLDLAFQSWNVLLAPSATPAPEVQRLQEACRTALAEAAPALKSRLGLDTAYLDSADTAAFLSRELTQAGALIELSGLGRKQ